MFHVNFWQLVIFAAGPWVGALMDSMPRVVAFKALCVVQVGVFCILQCICKVHNICICLALILS